jgi:hypothetical protein
VFKVDSRYVIWVIIMAGLMTSTIVGDSVGSMPSPYIPKTNLHFGSLWLPLSIVLAGPYHLLVHCCPLSLLAHTSLYTVAHSPYCPIHLAVLESNSLVPLHTSSSIVLATSCLSLLRPPTVLFGPYPSCAILQQTNVNPAKSDKVKRMIV